MTEAFHELYQKAKSVQQRFLNASIKIETDPCEVWTDNTCRGYTENTKYDRAVISMKIEPNCGKFIVVRIYFDVHFNLKFNIFHYSIFRRLCRFI